MNELIENPPELEEAPPVEEPEAKETPVEEPEVTPPVDEKPDASALQAEIERLAEKKRKLEEDTRYWREQKARERGEYFRGRKEESTQPATPPAGQAPAQAPRVDDFDDYEQYTDAKIKFEVDQARKAWERDITARQQNIELQRKEADLHAKIQRGFEKYEDFEDVALAETVPITPVIKDILADCEAPEDVAYYLGTNRAEAIKISHMTPTAAARAIFQIEQGLTMKQPSASAKEPNKPKTTKAPAPINPLGSAASGAGNVDPEKMTPAEYDRWRRSQGAKPY